MPVAASMRRALRGGHGARATNHTTGLAIAGNVRSPADGLPRELGIVLAAPVAVGPVGRIPALTTTPTPRPRTCCPSRPPGSRRPSTVLVSCLLMLLGREIAPAPALAASEVVTSCASDADLVAKLAALDVAGGGTLTFACGANPVAIVVQQPLAIGANPVTIDGGGKVTLSGGNSVGVFDVGAGRSLVLKRMTITRGTSLCGAVCVGDGARLKATQVDFKENSSSASGGAVFATAGAKIRLKRCKLVDNTAASSGGAIASIEANVTALISTFEGNQAGQFGAAIYADHAAAAHRMGVGHRRRQPTRSRVDRARSASARAILPAPAASASSTRSPGCTDSTPGP
ncbi:MAG: hypothetical protein U0842_02510 [Candidatus Binatia bacterium]